jgi:hypothetical protein
MNSNPYHFSSTSTVVSSDASGQSAPAAGRYSRFRTTLITVIDWQLTCLLFAKVYDHFIVDLIVAGYPLIYGDTEDSYRTFARFAPHIALLVVTLSATIVTLPVIEKLAGCRASAQQKLFALFAWEIVVMGVLVWSYESSFSFLLHTIDLYLRGQTVETYSFRNQVLPRLVAWLVCTVPVGWLAVTLYYHRHKTQPPADLRPQ